jgi:hypothetical protein
MKSANATPAEFAAAREPTGPEPVTLWKVLRSYRADPLVRWTMIRETYGPVARYTFGLSDSYFISSAEGARRILQENAANYTKEHGSYRILRRIFGNGLFTSEGSFCGRQDRPVRPGCRPPGAGAASRCSRTVMKRIMNPHWSENVGAPRFVSGDFHEAHRQAGLARDRGAAGARRRGRRRFPAAAAAEGSATLG